MLRRTRIKRKGIIQAAVLAGLGLVTGTLSVVETYMATVGAARFAGPTSSQPLAMDAEGTILAVANPDSNSVTFFDVRQDKNKKLAIVGVQQEPNGVALTPNGRKAYVANTVSGTVTVIPLNIANGSISKPSRVIKAGVEPYGVAMAPNGTKVYVSNARSNDITVIDTATDSVVRTIEGVGAEPRGMAITNDGDNDDLDETLVVTQFLALPAANKIDGQDDAKNGRLTLISTATDTVVSPMVLNPITDTGFKAAGDAIQRIPPGPDFKFQTGAYPNQLNNVAIKGRFVYVPNTGASPNGPVRFNVNTQSLLSVGDLLTSADAGVTINMHTAVRDQAVLPKLFITQPWAMAFKRNAGEGYVVSAASNIVVKVLVNSATGLPAVAPEPGAVKPLQIPVGKNPRGIVINPSDTRAYVMNYVSRDVSVIKLDQPKEAVVATLVSTPQPAPGSVDDKIQAGKELYHTSVGVFDPATPGGVPITGRMSSEGWGACAACHPNGLTDNVVWIFPAGPRKTIPQHGDFDPSDPTRSAMRVLNWSANRDEQEDFELNIRAVSGGQGLIVLADGVTPDPNVVDLAPVASGGRNQLKVRGFGAWDAIKSYVQFGIRAPLSPVPATDPDVIAGRALFTSANCQSCHGGANWTSSRVTFTPPPGAGVVVAGQVFGELRKVDTFNPALLNEVRQNAAAPLGPDGFVPPSLLSISAFPATFLHGGELNSLDDVMANVTHRAAGTGGVDTLSNANDRAKVVKFLRSIDKNTPPIP